MRILICANLLFPYFTGGKKRMCYYYARYLAARGHSVRVVTQRRERQDATRDALDSFSVFRFPTRQGSALSYNASEVLGGVAAIRAACSGWEPDVVFVHDPNMALAAALSPAARRPTVYGFHAGWALEWRQGYEHMGGAYGGRARAALRRPLAGLFFRYLLGLERAMLERSARVLVLSEFSRGILRSTFGVPDRAVALIPGTADMDWFTPGAVERGKEFRIFTLRRLEPRMGLENLVEAAALLRDEGKRFVLHLGGRGRLEGTLRGMIARKGLDERVRLLGYLSNERARQEYRGAHLSVLPTLAYEGFGLATLEALACGAPVLGTRVGATPEVLGPLSERLLCEATPRSLADGMRYWMQHPAELAELSARCPAYARERYGPDVMARRIEELFEGLLGGQR